MQRASGAVRDLPGTLGEELLNIFASTPPNLEQPPYEVIGENEGFELREYDSYVVATTYMANPVPDVELNDEVFSGGTKAGSPRGGGGGGGFGDGVCVWRNSPRA